MKTTTSSTLYVCDFTHAHSSCNTCVCTLPYLSLITLFVQAMNVINFFVYTSCITEYHYGNKNNQHACVTHVLHASFLFKCVRVTK